jgi:DNA-binding LytR/AlgR family response regulator
MRALIVDDEPPSRNEMRHLLEKAGGVEVCGEAATGKQALAAAARLKPDVVFLDIQMPGSNGFAVAQELLDSDDPPLIVFATAFDAHAIKAFEINAVDYLLKPFSLERVSQAVERARAALSREGMSAELLERVADVLRRVGAPAGPQNGLKRITVLKGGRMALLDPAQILFASVEDEVVQVVTSDCRYTTSGTLNDLEARLSGGPFIRTHRGWLVNLDHVKEVIPWFNGTYQLVMKDKAGTEVPVSRYRVRELKDAVGLS